MKNRKQNPDPMCRQFSIVFHHFTIILLMSSGFPLLMNCTPAKAQRISRDLNVDILVNQAGYHPGSGKICVVKGESGGDFEVIHTESNEVVFTGQFKPSPGDFGNYLTGDFTAVIQQGHYYIKSDTLRSWPFEISVTVYQDPINQIVNYFSKQRCGASTTGYLTPCHTDDGIRMDNGRHQDVSGGWHDASDLRKWVSATIYGMVGLGKAYELQDRIFRDEILEELKWGNLYFLKMQEPEGYVMNYVGGDVKKHSDSNRWTDNEVGEEGGELAFVKPDAGRSTADMLLFGRNDDRVIRTDQLDIGGQYNFVSSEALMARITASTDSAYSEKCLEAAIRCYDWCGRTDKELNPLVTGAAIQASLELFKTTGEKKYKEDAVSMASRLEELQAGEQANAAGGFFFTTAARNEPYKNISRGCLEFISLCDLVEAFPWHEKADTWKDMIRNYANHYLLYMSQKNSFGIVPFGLYTGKDPGGSRKTGKYWYRYFMQPELDWWVGVNANLASAGVGLKKASCILNDPGLLTAAQRQLDWIIGVNPFNSSTLIGVGYNHPEHFPGSTFYPLTPVISGAVMNGLGGDQHDQPVIGTGNWQISEYWTPMVAYTLWLMAEFTAME
ncbi:MAG: glycoside hydrolase family 9 protein [Cyclobacteriaceae bacterium]|nr:glycoside hydrolase family 9 protein [Cyclobacteriaceae bacterium]